ncbi:unnamed protein product [Rotaria socialis]|uniref:MANSC domain-containing protein n=2 Tax=Rotaria socialis TaxID=392032 RepID=A0A817TYJ0_9BILA|nr:unnamed protein product [Rotaria socialis]
MRLRTVLFHLLLIVQVDLRRYNNQSDNETINELDSLVRKYKSHSNKEYYPALPNNDQNLVESLQREKKYSPRKKVLSDVDNRDEQEKPLRRTHLSKSSNRSDLSNKSNRLAQTTAATTSYFDEASLCINEFDVKTEQLVKVKELKNGARMIRFIQIDEPSTSHGLDIKDICMLNCCVEDNCDLAMLSEQRTNDGYKCYLFACNGSCTYAPHQDYTSMILRKDLPIIDDSSVTNKQSKTNEKTSAASSSTLSGTCRSIEFSCRDGSCIPYYDVCNSYEDCPSGIDEAMCSTEFSLHQRTQQENRKKPAADVDSDTNVDIDESFDEALDEDQLTTTAKILTKVASEKSSSSKGKSKNREGEKQDKNVTSPFFYNIDLETQERVSRLQKLKEYLEETKGPEAWYHLFQTLVQHQQQDHSNIEPEQSGAISSNDDENFREHLLALEQQWLADRQKSSTTIAITRTTPKPKVTNRKIITSTTKRMKIANDDDDDQRQRRPLTGNDDETTDDEDVDDGDRYYWQPTYDDHRENQDNTRYQQRMKTITTTTRKPKTKYPQINRDTTSTTLLRANNLDTENFSHTRSFLRESSVILLFLLGLVFTIILLVFVGFYCRDSWKHGRLIKNRSHDADYLINGLYL